MISGRSYRGLWWGVYLLQSSVYVIAGTLHLDEGAYLYAARAVFHGQVLYRDFFFLQPPVHPYVYGVFQALAPGLLTGRITSVLLGIIATLMLMRIARLLAGEPADSLTLAIIACNPFQIYFFTITRLYSLTAMLLYAGCLSAVIRKRPGTREAVLASLFLALALATRLTVLPAAFLLIFYFLLRGESPAARILPLFLTAGAVLAIFLPYLLLTGDEKLWFNLLGMNLSLHSHNFSANIMQKIRATSQLVRYYFLLLLMTVPILTEWIHQEKNLRFHRVLSRIVSQTGVLWLVTVVTLTTHTTAKIFQVSSQSVVMPLLACLVSLGWGRIYREIPDRGRRLLRFLFLTGCVLTIASYGRSSIDFIGGKPALLALREQAAFVSQHTAPGQKVFSADSALVAVEADRDVLRGMAGSDLFPGWDREKCERYNVLNFEIMRDYIRDQTAPLLIHGDRSFSLSLPYLEPIDPRIREEFMNLVRTRYRVAAVYPNLFIPGTSTYYYLAKTEP